MDKIIIKESVRNLVEFCLKQGDIDNRFSGNGRALEGTKAHQKLQEDNGKIYENYQKEVYLTHEFEMKKSVINIEGRADGIINEDDKIIIEEIKSTYKNFSYIDDSNEVHWAQAKVYALIYGEDNKIDTLHIRLSYVQLETDEVKSFERKFTLNELKEFTLKLLEEYERFSILIYKKMSNRNESIKDLEFPFEKYREGQRKLINIAYQTIKEKEMLFAQAPTGIGKTISTIFPAVKALGSGIGEKIIYLTAKTINRQVAEDTYDKLRQGGLKFISITIMAKEKICINKEFDCNPENCIYAKDYYSKVKKVILDIIEGEDRISSEILQNYAEKYEVCPFELSLDLSMYCDGIIGDYNYIFDPRVSLGRILENKGNIVLIDEAHNLIDRARMMYSASLSKDKIMECKKIAKGKLSKIHSVLGKINSYFIDLRNECEHKSVEWFYEVEEPKDLIKYLQLYLKESEEILIRGNRFEGYGEILQLYFDINAFISTMQLYDENYRTSIEKEAQDLKLTLYCVNPAKNLKEYLSKCYSAIFFSATISPIMYYVNMLGGNDETYRLKLPSPFKRENLNVYLSPINIRYKYRERTIGLVKNKILKFVEEQLGNYIIFSPSYVYMELLYDELTKETIKEFEIVKQKQNMSEEEKREFLSKFKENRNLLMLCVLGGMFSEGIDLPGEQLIGSVIVGVGYPMISMNNEIMKDFYNENGYDYAYVFPGINKVQQAVGRVIRTETDKGRILLIDDRYATNKYKLLLPSEWYPIKKY
ncbi:Rad3-related DNA helicase [Clostridium saccharoperbutylacetonicum]|uniref:DNA 5'-3' helicase n=1 Tax=Clostridium saccharoperbutylacetonicum N1-4(HMT) TaxID=931276 RepID=M1M151_9CLOT|nr:ATP-dependent DNA helicase [Clostridium saccharoperbutylacetonicum]AGF59285.1 Rad3-like DNA helicase [Clostridium saccharoperbutylacetonicum N1-4(HMT)]NRT59927.1 Rad3-related DNA helicase [Clostridium saccharoperbutylacetonicum]NSB23239.1 Rad3-related DNA helicase [Clostridium saccharoperbutylacetonicum]NSB42609.1 Rad3-related DNA helicase [Clostridium saccharoperbutylacetonicum]